ncbi:MAG: protein-disulfide reductase DsbD family protein [Alphaproteobacteria bacterium]|nr:protein-disulfide reductase DsbD family protein [Alphaproteobacteria bacterium]
MKAIGRSFAAALLLLLGTGVTAAEAAEATPWTGLPETEARLLAASSAVGTDARLTLGIEIRLAEGWKTYWRSPGDAGSPPRLDWGGSRNLASARMLWPAPKRFTAFDIDTFGYGDEVIFPILLTPETPGRALTVKLRVDYQVCKHICIPVTAELALELPAGPARETAHTAAIQRFRQAVPKPGGEGPIAIETVRLTGQPGAQTLEVTARSEAPLAGPDLIVEAPYPFYFDRPEVHLSADRRRAVLRLAVGGGKDAKSLAGTDLTLTLIDATGAGETRVVAGADD